MAEDNVNKKRRVKAIVKDASGDVVSEIGKTKYTMIPVDYQTKRDLIKICIANGGNKRSQGSMVRKLVKAELARMAEVG